MEGKLKVNHCWTYLKGELKKTATERQTDEQ